MFRFRTMSVERVDLAWLTGDRMRADQAEWDEETLAHYRECWQAMFALFPGAGKVTAAKLAHCAEQYMLKCSAEWPAADHEFYLRAVAACCEAIAELRPSASEHQRIRVAEVFAPHAMEDPPSRKLLQTIITIDSHARARKVAHKQV
jgi:hypothetical protein